MSQSALFIVGAVIFAITVYGSVMAGGGVRCDGDRAGNPRRWF